MCPSSVFVCDMCLRQTCVRLFYLSLLAKYLSISIGQCNGHTSPRGFTVRPRLPPDLSLCTCTSRSFIFQSWAIHPAPETGTHVSSMVCTGAPTVRLDFPSESHPRKAGYVKGMHSTPREDTGSVQNREFSGLTGTNFDKTLKKIGGGRVPPRQAAVHRSQVAREGRIAAAARKRNRGDDRESRARSVYFFRANAATSHPAPDERCRQFCRRSYVNTRGRSADIFGRSPRARTMARLLVATMLLCLSPVDSFVARGHGAPLPARRDSAASSQPATLKTRHGDAQMFGPGGGSFLNLGTPEMIVIGAAAWALLGPKELYRLAAEAGKFLGEWQTLGLQAKATFTDALESELREDEEAKRKEEEAAMPISDFSEVPTMEELEQQRRLDDLRRQAPRDRMAVGMAG